MAVSPFRRHEGPETMKAWKQGAEKTVNLGCLLQRARKQSGKSPLKF
jgi:hypothetical protein